MINREDVEALLGVCGRIAAKNLDPMKFSPIVPAPTLAALCRAWLAIQDAPEVCVWKSAVIGEGWGIYGTKDGGIIESLPFEGSQRVRIVKETEDGS